MAKIYTRHGDQGQSSLVGGERVNKNHPRLQAYGCIDELCSHLGFISSLIEANNTALAVVKTTIVKIQNELFLIGSLLACANPDVKNQLPAISDNHIVFLENEIDLLEKDLPLLKNFILPGGNNIAAYTHIARTVCRRAERDIYCLIELGEEEKDSVILRYINRLSDYLFVLSRWINYKFNCAEQIWKN